MSLLARRIKACFASIAGDLARGGAVLEEAGDIGEGKALAFWTKIMGEHADFIAHLLDPEEATLINKALWTAQDFDNMHKNAPASTKDEAVRKAVDDTIDVKTTATKASKRDRSGASSIRHSPITSDVRH
jgi:hypothetical protein